MSILGKDILNPQDKKCRIANKAYFLGLLIEKAHGAKCCRSTEDMETSPDGTTFKCLKCGRVWELLALENQDPLVVCVG